MREFGNDFNLVELIIKPDTFVDENGYQKIALKFPLQISPGKSYLILCTENSRSGDLWSLSEIFYYQADTFNIESGYFKNGSVQLVIDALTDSFNRYQQHIIYSISQLMKYALSTQTKIVLKFAIV